MSDYENWARWINPLTGKIEMYVAPVLVIEEHQHGNPEEYWGKFIAWLNYTDPIPGGHQALMGSIDRYKKIYLEANQPAKTIHMTEEQFRQGLQTPKEHE